MSSRSNEFGFEERSRENRSAV